MTKKGASVIISEQNIINTYNKWQQDQSELYYDYKKIKQENPKFGHKRIATLLNQPHHKTRWWHEKNRSPVPIQTVNWLKEKNLIPLTEDNPNLPLIAKLLGAAFGDGGIFRNLNAIFLSSSELEAVKAFGEDLKKVFGNEIEENSRIIEGGEWGHSWCYQNTNRNVIRFFQALGAPIGDKGKIELIVPEWILKSDKKVKDEFFGSIIGGEIGIPKAHKNSLDCFSLGITGKNDLAQNRTSFLNYIAAYLNENFVNTGKISINDEGHKNREGEPTKTYKLLISTEFENVVNFMTLTKINYCIYKKAKLVNTMNEFSEIKRQRVSELFEEGKTEEKIMNILSLSPASLYIIKNHEDFNDVYN